MNKLSICGRHLSTRNRVIIIILAVLLMVGLFVRIDVKPARAACTSGDFICDVQQAFQQLLDGYVTPLKAWLQLQANKALYTLEYSLSHTISSFMWGISKMLTTVGVGIGILNDWIAKNFFQPMIQVTSKTMQPIVGVFLFAAMCILGISYFLAAFIRLNVVSLRSIVVWWFAGVLFFSVGPSFYLSMRNIQQSLNSVFYASALKEIGNKNPFAQLAGGDPAADSPIFKIPLPCPNFPVYIPSSAGKINGFDVALAFQKGDGFDVVSGGSKCLGGGQQQDLPRQWFLNYGFFDSTKAPGGWSSWVTCPPAPAQCDYEGLVMIEVQKMQESVNQSFIGIAREWQSIPLVWFAIVEQLVALCLIIAQGLTFTSFACAILFAFFRRTEPVAWAVVDQWLALLIQSVVIALVQGMTIALYLAAANSGSPLVAMGVSIVALVMMVILLISGVKAVWSAFNKLFEAFGQASGGVFLSPGQAGSTVAGTALGVGGAVVTGGLSLASGAMNAAGSLAGGAVALNSGATWAQAAGVTFGGSKALDGAAYHIVRLPGMRDTVLGEAANQYVEGASTRRVGDTLLDAVPGVGGAMRRLGGASVGAALLTDRNPEHAEASVDERGQVYWKQPMLRRRTDEAMETLLSGPTWAAGQSSAVGRGGVTLTEADGTPIRKSDGAEAANPQSSLGRGTAFTPLVVNNDGNLDETIDQDLKRDLRADRAERAGNPGNESDRLGSSAQKLDDAGSRLKSSADALRQIAQTQATANLRQGIEPVEGRLNVSGTNNIAAILGRTIDALQQQNHASGQNGATSDRVGRAMAGVMGMTPVEQEGRTLPPIEGRTNRFQMFTDQALRAGLSGEDAAQVLREVKASPDGYMQAATRERLIQTQRSEHGESWNDGIQSVQALEHAARLVPSAVTAYGTRQMPTGVSHSPIVLSPANGNGGGTVAFTPAQPLPVPPKTTVQPQTTKALEGMGDTSNNKDGTPSNDQTPATNEAIE